MTQFHDVVETWLRREGSETPSSRVQEHLSTCDTCRQALAEIREVRSWYEDPGEILSAESAKAMRFRLQAAARASRNQTREKRREQLFSSKARPWAYAAAVLLVIMSAAAFARYGLPTVNDGVRERPSPPAKVRPRANVPRSIVQAPSLGAQAPALESREESRQQPRIVRHVSRPVGPPSETPPERDVDSAFGEAWRLYREGNTDGASRAFDALLDQSLGDRRPDVLFWSARAHLQSGQRARAVTCLEELVKVYPSSWHATEARELLRTELDARARE